MIETLQPQTGDNCPSCEGGHLHFYSSHNLGELYVRYLKCDTCKAKPDNNRVIVEAHQIRRRKRITRASIVHST